MTRTQSSFTENSIIYVAGHRGMVGSAIMRLLKNKGFKHIITRTSAELDLTNQAAVRNFFSKERIEHVFLAAAKVGGIYANNTYPAEFIYRNLMIQSNVIHESYRSGVKRLLFLGSSCIYPKFSPQPMREEHLLTGILEPTNEPYAIAKIAGIKMCESYNRQYGTDFRSVMPTNLYGPGDNFHLENSHVVPAILRKYHLAKLVSVGDLEGIKRDERVFGKIPEDIRKSLGLAVSGTAAVPEVVLWGSGTARREFLHVDDMALACLHVLSLEEDVYRNSLSSDVGPDRRDQGGGEKEASLPSFFNIGTGSDCTIQEVAEIIKDIVGYTGKTRYNSSLPDGTPRKLLDTTRINNLGWHPAFTLQEGLKDTYEWYCSLLDGHETD